MVTLWADRGRIVVGLYAGVKGRIKPRSTPTDQRDGFLEVKETSFFQAYAPTQNHMLLLHVQ